MEFGAGDILAKIRYHPGGVDLDFWGNNSLVRSSNIRITPAIGIKPRWGATRAQSRCYKSSNRVRSRGHLIQYDPGGVDLDFWGNNSLARSRIRTTTASSINVNLKITHQTRMNTRINFNRITTRPRARIIDILIDDIRSPQFCLNCYTHRPRACNHTACGTAKEREIVNIRSVSFSFIYPDIISYLPQD